MHQSNKTQQRRHGYQHTDWSVTGKQHVAALHNSLLDQVFYISNMVISHTHGVFNLQVERKRGCAAYCCSGDTHLYSWPKNRNLAVQWTAFVCHTRPDFIARKISVLCFRHFTDDSFSNLTECKLMTSNQIRLAYCIQWLFILNVINLFRWVNSYSLLMFLYNMFMVCQWYIQFRLYDLFLQNCLTRLKLKPNAVPSKVECNQDTPRKQHTTEPMPPRTKRSIIRELLKPDTPLVIFSPFVFYASWLVNHVAHDVCTNIISHMHGSPILFYWPHLQWYDYLFCTTTSVLRLLPCPLVV